MNAEAYTVRWGWCNENWQHFADFDAAIDAYIRRSVADSWGGASLLGDGADADCVGDPAEYVMCSDGLTEDERERVELADCVIWRWRRLRARALNRLTETGIKLFEAAPWSTAELEATATLEIARKRDERLVECALDRAEMRMRDEARMLLASAEAAR